MWEPVDTFNRQILAVAKDKTQAGLINRSFTKAGSMMLEIETAPHNALSRFRNKNIEACIICADIFSATEETLRVINAMYKDPSCYSKPIFVISDEDTYQTYAREGVFVVSDRVLTDIFAAYKLLCLIDNILDLVEKATYRERHSRRIV